MKAVLFQNLRQFHNLSMDRYARELLAALLKLQQSRWEFEGFSCNQVDWAAKAVLTEFGQKLAERLGRLIKYPILASQAQGDIFHVLDHSHAHLGLGLDSRKTVMTCHDVIPLLAMKELVDTDVVGLTRWTLPIRLACIRRCAAVIADSESTKEDLVIHANVPEDKIFVVYPGVNETFVPAESSTVAEACRNSIRNRFGIPEGDKIVLHVGQRVRYKNLSTLIRAIAVLKTHRGMSGVWLLHAGGDLFDEENDLIDKLNARNRVVHVGRVSTDKELANFYRAADVFVFPSLWEGFGWPPLEAMSCGTPVITSNVASLPEVVGKAGLMVAPTDLTGLVEALKRVLEDESLRQSMIAQGLNQARQFSWERSASKTIEVYDHVAGQFDPGRGTGRQ